MLGADIESTDDAFDAGGCIFRYLGFYITTKEYSPLHGPGVKVKSQGTSQTRSFLKEKIWVSFLIS